MSDPPNSPWYVVRLRSNFEKIATQCLREKGYVTFLPLYRTRRKLPDRVKEVETPLFPGYTFCRFEAQHKLPILMSPGVVSILEFANGPVPVSDSDINAIQAVVKSGLMVGRWPFLQLGQLVLVEHGPLKGVEGLIVKVKEDFRLVVSVSLLQRSVCVEIDREWVRPLSFSSTHTRADLSSITGSRALEAGSQMPIPLAHGKTKGKIASGSAFQR